MKALIVFLLAPWLAFLLPWAVPAYQRRWGLAAALFVPWTASILCAALLWSGPGVALFALTGAVAVLITRIDLTVEQ